MKRARTFGILAAAVISCLALFAAACSNDTAAPQATSAAPLKDKYLPLAHDCQQVAATTRAENMTENEFAGVCNLLKETEDVFHATMQTDPAKPPPLRATDYYSKVETLLFNNSDDMHEHFRAVTGEDDTHFGGTFEQFGWGENPVTNQTKGDTLTIVHEHVHYLDHKFNMNCNSCEIGQEEGLAEYITSLVVPDRFYTDNLYWDAKLIDDGSNLPPPLAIWEAWDNDSPYDYGWRYFLVRFLFEEYPKVILTIYDNYRTASSAQPTTGQSYINDVIPPLTDHFHRWLREFTRLTTRRQIEPVTMFVDGDPVTIDMQSHFFTSQELSLEIAVFHDNRELTFNDGQLHSEILNVQYYNTKAGILGLLLRPNAPGTVEVRVTATVPDGQSAELTFPVTVQDL